MEWIRGPTVGRGSSAAVSLATAVPSGELFAVKSAELSRSGPLRRERLVLSELASPHIVKYMGHDVTRESGKLYYNLWTEYLPSGTLSDEIRRCGGRLEEPEIRSHARKILRGLEYLHENGLVHGDVKSQNLLMGSDGLKIADLGCARFVETRQSSRMLSASHPFSGVDSRETHNECGENGVLPEHTKTSSDVFSGTPMFMAPEVARNEEQSFPSDVWSVGCTVIEMATGKGPWAESDPVSVLYRIGFSSDAPEIPRRLSDSGRDFLAKCLMRDPRERWTVKELLEHPFLDVSKISEEEFTRNSPSGVLDSGFWDSVDVWESPRNRNGSGVVDSRSCPSTPATERMKRLMEDCESSSANWSLPDEASDEEEWITVRSDDQHKEEAGEISRPVDDAPPPFADSISDQEELQSSPCDDNSHHSLRDRAIVGGVIFKEDSFVDFEDDFRDNDNVLSDLAYEEEDEITDSVELQVLRLNLKAPFPVDLLTSLRVFISLQRIFVRELLFRGRAKRTVQTGNYPDRIGPNRPVWSSSQECRCGSRILKAGTDVRAIRFLIPRENRTDRTESTFFYLFKKISKI